MFFSKFRKTDTPTVAETSDNTEIISDRQLIIQILHKIVREQRQMEASIAGYHEKFNTAILGINPKTNLLAVDAIRSKAVHEFLLKNKKLHLSGNRDGSELECDLTLISVTRHDDTTYYKMEIPKVVIYTQRRLDYRVPLTNQSQFSGHLELEQNKLITGYAADLSLHGLGVIFKIPKSIGIGNKIIACTLQLPNDDPFYFDLHVCFVQNIRHRGSTRVGGQFIQLDMKDKKRLAKIIRAQERQLAQKFRV